MRRELDKIYNKYLNNKYEKIITTIAFIMFVIVSILIYSIFEKNAYLIFLLITIIFIVVISIMIYFGKVTKNKIVIKLFNKYFKKREKNIELVYKEMKTLLEKNNLLNTNCILAIKEEYKRKKNYEIYIALYSMYLSVIGLYSNKFNTQALDILVVIIPFMILMLMWYIRIVYELITNKDRYYFNNMDDIFYKLLGECNR